jgi:hypothetical protein
VQSGTAFASFSCSTKGSWVQGVMHCGQDWCCVQSGTVLALFLQFNGSRVSCTVTSLAQRLVRCDSCEARVMSTWCRVVHSAASFRRKEAEWVQRLASHRFSRTYPCSCEDNRCPTMQGHRAVTPPNVSMIHGNGGVSDPPRKAEHHALWMW